MQHLAAPAGTLSPKQAKQATPAPEPNGALVVLSALLFCAGMLVVSYGLGVVEIYRYAYPGLALALGAVLYRFFPVTYIGYTCWVWFLTPFMRRVIDYAAGWQDPSIVMLAPFMVSGLGMLTLIRHRRELLHRAFFPFALVLIAIGYAYVVGLLQQGFLVASYSLLNWLAPVLFGVHVIFHWHEYPAFRRCVQRTFVWGMAVMGIYALIQFYLMPPWDAYWMENADLGSIGKPQPLVVRVFSTLNSPEPYAHAVMAGLLLLFSLPTWKHVLAAVPGYIGFLLSLVRSAWGGWAVGLLAMAFTLSGRMRTRLLGVLFLGLLIAVPLTQVDAISEKIGRRFATFSDLSADDSFQARMTLYRSQFLVSITNPLGSGIGWAGSGVKMAGEAPVAVDSGIILIAYQLGWPGMLLYLGAITALLVSIWQGQRQTGDFFASICFSIVLATVSVLPFRNAFNGSSGVVFWCFVGLGVASHRYLVATALEEAYAASVKEALEEG